MGFIKSTLLTTSLLLLLAYLFIVSVDSYDKFGWNPWSVKTKAVSSARENKYNQINSGRYNYNMFMLGSSRVLRYSPKLIEKFTDKKVYNYGVENSNAEDLLATLRHTVDVSKPDEVFLMVDFYMLNSYIGLDKRLLKSHLGRYLKNNYKNSKAATLPLWEPSYFTVRALLDSLSVLINQDEAKNIYLENGQHIIEETDKTPKLAEPYFTNQYMNYKIDRVRVKRFQEIEKICRVNKIKLTVAISPMMVSHLNRVMKDPVLSENLKKFKRKMVEIFGSVYDFNNYSMSHYSENRMWYDSIHPTEVLADIITTKIFNPTPSNFPDNFGAVIDKSNIESYLKSDFKLEN
jgi:hypothetical protein